jgi:holin-like protein
MKAVIEFVKIIFVYYLAVFLSKSIPIPSGLLGMMILFLALNLHLIDLKPIEKYVDFILKHLAFFFVPLAVILTLDLHHISDVFLSVIFIILVTTFIVMGSTAFVVERLEKGGK